MQCRNDSMLHQRREGKAVEILGLLGVAMQDVDVLVGLTCTPIAIIGVSAGEGSSSEMVCCGNNNNGGRVSISCVPVSI
ncbi:hypothetical protein C8Q74DRAFT_1223566 [Fomes fomentarius]|nr:hypothetical protein C8Q74DRAFT_1223566 [Fomes fomentarius]